MDKNTCHIDLGLRLVVFNRCLWFVDFANLAEWVEYGNYDEQTNAGTQARRHAGTQVRRHAGTQARRHAGTQARRQAGTQARRHAGICMHTLLFCLGAARGCTAFGRQRASPTQMAP